MQVLYEIWNVIFNQVITKPQLLLAIIVALGYALLKRPFTTILAGAIKTAVGVMVLQVGAGQLVGTFRPILVALGERFGITGTIIDPYVGFPAALSSLGDNASWVGYTILVALAVNIILVAITKMRGIFLTGHIMFQQSCVATAVIAYTLGLPLLPTVLLSGALVGIYWAVGTNALIKPTNTVTNNAGFTIGHQQMLMDWLASKYGHVFGSAKDDDCENLELPGWLAILQDNIVAMAVIMFLFVFVIMMALGIPKVQEMAGADNWFVYTLLTGMSFAVYVTIILTGVRLFVAELANSFNGISQKLLKDSVVGVDCPAIFPFSPNAWILGFLFTTLGELIAIVGLIIFKSPVLIIAGFVPLFFDGGPIGVYANKHGGFKAVAFFCTVTGIVQVVGAAIMVPMSGMVGGWMGNFDWSTVWLAITALLRVIGNLFGLPVPPYGV
ncbi:MAG: ascorbate system component [Chloroflexota bacterium]|nr:ascorbate system component [Chloroflexota bacterium]